MVINLKKLKKYQKNKLKKFFIKKKIKLKKNLFFYLKKLSNQAFINSNKICYYFCQNHTFLKILNYKFFLMI